MNVEPLVDETQGFSESRRRRTSTDWNRHESGAPGPRDEGAFDFWYPTWDAWKFRRTMSYWIAICYLEGSILFTIGAFFSLTALSERGEEWEHALVASTYFTGGIAFTVGAFLGVVSVINLPNNTGRMALCLASRGQWRILRTFVSWKPVVGYHLYLAGALFFNVNTIFGFMELSWLGTKILVWFAAILGSMGFLIGGLIECEHNAVLHSGFSHVWFVAVDNTIGAAFFLIAGVSGFLGAPPSVSWWLVDMTYLVGSIAFACGAFHSIWLFKCEQFGMGFLPEINTGTRAKDPDEFTVAMTAQYGCGRGDWTQVPFLAMYILNASAAVLSVSLTVNLDLKNPHRVLQAIIQFGLSHGVLLLGSVIHHVPTAAPFSWLLIYMRLILFVYTISSWLEVIQIISDGGQSN